MSNRSQALLDTIQGFSESEIVQDTICILKMVLNKKYPRWEWILE